MALSAYPLVVTCEDAIVSGINGRAGHSSDDKSRDISGRKGAAESPAPMTGLSAASRFSGCARFT
jgi:hypothetical protein